MPPQSGCVWAWRRCWRAAIISIPQPHLRCPPEPRSDSCIDDALQNVNSEAATATEPTDLAAIRALVTSLPGQFATLDGTVRQHLHRCVACAPSTAVLRVAVCAHAIPTQRTVSRGGRQPLRWRALLCRWFEEKGALKSARRLPPRLSRASVSPGSGSGKRTLPHASVVGGRPASAASAVAEAPSNDYLDVHAEVDDDSELTADGFGFGDI